ncbi:MAG: sodium:calcium antiporter [Hyphomicrobiaceae bacterium]
MPDFAEFGLGVNLAAFATAAVLVWLAGSRISRYADEISVRTGLSHALLGLLLLGGVTSLPEVAVTLSASLTGNPTLAVNNILGGVAMQVAILAVADFFMGRRALTAVVPDPVVLLQGSLNVVLLAVVAAASVIADVTVLGVGLWSWLILALFLLALRMLASADQRRPWLSNISREQEKEERAPDASKARAPDQSFAGLIGKSTAAGAVILAAGYVVSRSAEVIADETDLGQSFVGAVLVAISTSLPELSTVLSAVRLNLYTMAISDILGTNLFDVALLFVVDAGSPDKSVLSSTGTFATVGAILGILVTGLFLVGLSERRDRTVLRLGVDSTAVLVAYLGGLVLLYTLR